MTINVDLEATNRCNAHCHFCPRDNMPDQGVMSPATFERALRRTIELRSVCRSLGSPDFSVGFCGLGEPLLNRHLPSFVRRVRDAGFRCAVSSNGALLNEDQARALLDAGVQEIKINVSDIDEAYERVYKLPFNRTLDNIVRFAELARDACQVTIMLVDHRGDPAHLTAMRAYWQRKGFNAFNTWTLINRAGALAVDDMQYPTYPEVAEARVLLQEAGVQPVCPAPFLYLFVGYDGQYYLDSSDWKKDVPLGSVFDVSFPEIMHAKLRHVLSREPICKLCSLDPTNTLADALRHHATPDEVQATIDTIRRKSDFSLDLVRVLAGQTPSGHHGPEPRRTRVPVHVA